jgi:hypothetical protein
MQEAGFGIKEIALVEMPKEFPQSGFQLGAIHLKRKWKDQITLTDLSGKISRKDARKNPLKRCTHPPYANVYRKIRPKAAPYHVAAIAGAHRDPIGLEK